jgi:hypothetical protein
VSASPTALEDFLDERHDHRRQGGPVASEAIGRGGTVLRGGPGGEQAQALDETLDHKVTSGGRGAARIREMRDFYAFLYQEMPEIVAGYEKWRAEQRRDEP